MTKACDGALLVEMLLAELACDNKNQLANRLGVAAAKVQSWENAKSLSKTVVKNVIAAVRNAAIRTAIEPIMEFHALNHLHGHDKDTLLKKIDNKVICERLKDSTGIYSFYDSNGRIIYVGKTEKNTLMAEMTQAFNLSRPNYSRKLADKNGKFGTNQLSIRDTAEFVSAYKVDEHAIGNVEAFLTRMMPNDIVNKKTENFKLG